ncbi:hypothetical protein CROQUDRAFT_513574 [Cronartium quercuum f. sp. fusiforme G11]|uniref:Uncharacterized protein n=1 Tax=Cronartium quercuum f. sp. fusiforme G11 TaxID=708437 RepID=A0A9P6NID1_9BASI|nr:hypothetical protein CROQUDRAFT_513574 [Cronartium quercuum f. sp. fusiforme G11]
MSMLISRHLQRHVISFSVSAPGLLFPSIQLLLGKSKSPLYFSLLFSFSHYACFYHLQPYFNKYMYLILISLIKWLSTEYRLFSLLLTASDIIIPHTTLQVSVCG